MCMKVRGRLGRMRLALRSFVVWCLTLAAVGALAQIPMPSGSSDDPPGVPSSLASPQATVRTFLESMNDDRVRDAAATLDLTSVNLVLRDTQGPRLARMLFDVLNRTIYVEIDEVPDGPEGEPYLVVRPLSEDGRGLGAITVARGVNGAWRFSGATVEALPKIWEGVRDRSIIQGLTELDARTIAPGQWMRSQVPVGWRGKAFWLEHWQWMFLVGLLLVSVLMHLVARLLLAIVLRVRFKVVGTRLSEAARRGLRRSVGWMLAATSAVLALPYLNLPEVLGAPLVFSARLMQFATAVWMLFAIWDAVMEAFSQRATNFVQRADDILIPIASKLGKFIIFAGCTVLFAASLGINLAGLLAGVGIGGLVLALAAKDSVENVFGSLTILLDMPFGIGDWVRIGDIDGTVEEINLRSTRVRTFDDSVITVPNSTMIKASVENLGLRRYRRLRTQIALTYNTPADKIEEFCAGVRELIANHPQTRKDKYFVEMNQMNDSSLDVMLYMYFETTAYAEEVALRGAFLLDIKRLAEKIGVDFAFPSRTLYMQPSDAPHLAPASEEHSPSGSP